MPKKGKKGKGKGKKGKKSSKKGKKSDSVKSMAVASSKLWEARLDVVEKSRHEYRENARRLVLENDTLNTQMEQTEKDTIDVITFLKRQDQEKDAQIEKLVQQMRDLKKDHRKEKEQIVDDFQQQLSELEQKLSNKTHDVQVMQSELKMVKEFRRKRGQMQRDLEDIKETMLLANKEHKDTLTRMEQKFFEEKMRLQQEANQKIAELSEKAHTEAIANLDETTRNVYKENVRVNEALSYHMAEGDKLKKVKGELEEENTILRGEKEMNSMVIQEKVSQSRQQKSSIKELQEKVETLEKALSHLVHEFEMERKSLIRKAQVENQSATTEISKLQRIVELKSKEMNKVKRLAKNILDQRTDVERFFLEALEHVKHEIAANQMQYRRDAQQAYHQRMLDAHTGKGDYPKIRTFNRSDHSTNSVFRDLEAAERLVDATSRIDISELTWEQKERVLRFLFAKMNGVKGQRGRSAPQALTHPSSDMPQITDREAWSDDVPTDDKTFLTQARVEDTSTIERLPDINKMTPHMEAEPVS